MASLTPHRLAFIGSFLWIGLLGATPALAGVNKSWFRSAIDRMVQVVTIDGQAPINDNTKVYTSKLVKEDNTITLKGQVPSDNDLKVLQGILAAASPRITFVDRSKPDASIADRDTWLAGMTFAMRHLTRLENGSVTLKGTSVCFDGSIKADDDFAAFQQKLADELPKGLTLAQNGIRPAAVRPFIWLAQFRSGTLSLSGHVPDEFGQFLVSYAKNTFKQADVDDGMASARGAPDGWIGAAKISLDMLNLLQQGRVILTDRVIKLEGVFSSPGMSDILKAYGDSLPKGFSFEPNVREPSLRTPALQAGGANLAASSSSVVAAP